MADLLLRALSKSYARGSIVLHPFDLHVRSGELIVLVGPSGCGKSTLLKLVAGLEPIDEGQVTLGGRDITHLDARRRGIAMVFQNYALYPHLSVRDNLAYPLRRAGMARRTIDDKVVAVAAQLRLDALLARRPAQLSGGQKQRVAMGRAIIREPELFLLDEPLSNLDAALRTHVRGEIHDLQRRLGTTMIYVTHDQVEAQTLADRVVIMRGGQIQQIGSPRDIYAEPANLFAASFLVTTPPNVLPARVDAGDGTVSVGGQTLSFRDLPGETRAALSGQRDIFVAIRPEAMVRPADTDDGPPPLVLGGPVTRREFVGGSQIVHFAAGCAADAATEIEELSGRRATDDLVWIASGSEVGERVELAVAPKDLLFFAPDGAAIGRVDASSL